MASGNLGWCNIDKNKFIPVTPYKMITIISVFWLEPITNPPIWETVARLVEAYHPPICEIVAQLHSLIKLHRFLVSPKLGVPSLRSNHLVNMVQ